MLRMEANGDDEKSLIIIIIIAGRDRLSYTGKCLQASSRCILARTQGLETTWCKLNHRLEPSSRTRACVSSLKNMASVEQRTLQGLLQRFCACEGGRINCRSRQRRHEEPEPEPWMT